MRPVADSKEEPGRVYTTEDLIALAEKVCRLDINEIPRGALRHDTELMLSKPVKILKEWRLWIVEGKVVTFSLYKEGARVDYRPEIDADALEFGQFLADAHPTYSHAYVMDLCRTPDGLRMIETNSLNAAGLYAADLQKLVEAIESLSPSL